MTADFARKILWPRALDALQPHALTLCENITENREKGPNDTARKTVYKFSYFVLSYTVVRHVSR